MKEESFFVLQFNIFTTVDCLCCVPVNIESNDSFSFFAN